MFQIYLPVAEIAVDPLVILALGAVVGLLSGLFGVGGGFLMTPALIFLGVPPAVAVGTQANQLVASGVSGVLGHWRRQNVDFELGRVMLAGSLVGTAAGVQLFSLLQAIGQIDLVISLSYVILLGIVGVLMVVESVGQLLLGPRTRTPGKPKRPALAHWPLRMRFKRSGLYISALLPFGIGLLGGVLVAIMGIGGGFVLVPAMIYLIGMPTALVAGTSLYQMIFATALATILHAVQNNTVDAFLALLLVIGGVIGAQMGTVVAGRMPAAVARATLGGIVLALAVVLLSDLVLPPTDRFELDIEGGL